MISLYTTLFNIDKLDVDLDEVFSNWLYYVDEIVIATFRWEHEKVRDRIFKSKFYDPKKIGVVSRHLEIETDIYWEGKLKNAALQNCRKDIALQCDLDERISGKKEHLEICCKAILDNDFPCSIMLPTIDLYEDLDHYINKVDFYKENPKIIHLGFLDLEQRNKVNQFWGKVWNHRSTGEFDKDHKPEKIKIGDKRKQKHNLSKPLWQNLK